jgi:hypothetical protein
MAYIYRDCFVRPACKEKEISVTLTDVTATKE